MQIPQAVSVRQETLVIPTYAVYPPEIAPLFIEKRAYQGSSGKVYPLPVIEKIADEKHDMPYEALILENEYLAVTILPQIGGKIHRAYDKTNGYDFVYHNHVIKPALVGLAGPWVSGGIEFNWPQHHRPTTFSEVDHLTETHADGSCSVVVGEIDPMYGTKSTAKITLYPGKAYIEIRGQLYNPTGFAQSFLWWANPAVPVNEHTCSVFPPDVNAVMDHGKRAVSTFPIATGEYYKYDYSAGVDISRYRNIKVPTSYMAASSAYDFVGNYDESVGAGLLHVADHHIAPGKKQWTWGNADFGRTWDRNLTDADGPYIELMTGVYTDNQPDFTWLKPHEEKTFTQVFMPYHGVGRVSNATRDAVLGAVQTEAGVEVKVYATAVHPQATVIFTDAEGKRHTQAASLTPETYFTCVFADAALADGVTIAVVDAKDTLCTYTYQAPSPKAIPTPAQALKAPRDLSSAEELYLAAQHLEQYRHATRDPADYYEEGLRRDPTDIRLNNGYGVLLMKRGRIAESIPYFQAAIAKQTWKNPNPYYGECYYHLGLAAWKSAQPDLAYDAFYKAAWSAETQSVGFYCLACLSVRRGERAKALEFIEQSMLRNWHDMNARTLKAALLRADPAKQDAWIAQSEAIDPLCMSIQYEKALAANDEAPWLALMRAPAFNYIELAILYMQFGFTNDALHILKSCPTAHPMLYYLAATLADDPDSWVQKAEALPVDGCNPSRLEELAALQFAVKATPHAAHAQYYLGNLYYDKKQYALAIEHWYAALQQQPDFAMCLRNLSIAACNKQQDAPKAMALISRACEQLPTYPRFWLERDQLAAKTASPVAERLDTLQAHFDAVSKRDDLILRYIALCGCAGDYQAALQLLKTHIFHPWEGGEGKVSAQYRFTFTELGKQSIRSGDYAQAVDLLTQTLAYPANLGEGKLPNASDHQAYYWMGVACRAMGNEPKAKEYFILAAQGASIPQAVLYYNDLPSDFIFYQGLAHRALGREADAMACFNKLISYGKQHLSDPVEYDFFAVSLPEIEVYQDDPQWNNQQYCNYLRALGELGLGNLHDAKCLLRAVLQAQPDHQGALIHLRMASEAAQ